MCIRDSGNADQKHAGCRFAASGAGLLSLFLVSAQKKGNTAADHRRAQHADPDIQVIIIACLRDRLGRIGDVYKRQSTQKAAGKEHQDIPLTGRQNRQVSAGYLHRGENGMVVRYLADVYKRQT